MTSRAGSVAVALAVAAAMVAAVTGWQANPAFLVAAAVALGSLGSVKGLTPDVPWPRGRLAPVAIPAAVAVAAAARTLALPYFSDDYWLWQRFGRMSSPLEALAPPENAAGYRPVAWVAFWGLAKLAPFEALGARLVCVALLALNAALLGPALRRCGVRRGTAGAAATLFAAGPVATETAAWVSNLYSLLAGAFALASLATLPHPARGLRRLTVPASFLFLALLSKEDTFLWPLVLAGAAARFRAARWREGLRAVAPFLGTLVVVLAMRAAFFGGLTVYRDALTGESRVHRILESAWKCLTLDFPSNAFLPVRRFDGGSGALERVTPLLPLVSLGLAAAVRAGRRVLAAPAMIVTCGVLPTLALLPVNPGLGGIRHLYVPSFGLSLFLATWIAGSVRVQSWRPWLLAAVVAAALAVEQYNYRAWSESVASVRGAQHSAEKVFTSAWPGARILTLGLPMVVHGAPCFGVQDGLALVRGARRTDVETFDATHGFGAFDDLLEFDPARQTVRRGLPDHPVVHLAPGTAFVVDLSRPEDARRLTSFGVKEVDGGRGSGAAGWSSEGTAAFVALPPMRVEAGTRLSLDVDGEATDSRGRAAPLPVAVTLDRGGSYERVLYRGPGAVPEGVRRLRFEIVPLMDSLTIVRRLTFRAD